MNPQATTLVGTFLPLPSPLQHGLQGVPQAVGLREVGLQAVGLQVDELRKVGLREVGFQALVVVAVLP